MNAEGDGAIDNKANIQSENNMNDAGESQSLCDDVPIIII